MHPSDHHELLPLQGGYSEQSEEYPKQPRGYPGQPGGYPGQPGEYPGQPGGYPGQPGGPSVAQHTAVNFIKEQPMDHVIWSTFSLVYANPFCLGLIALIYSVKARDRKREGDLEGARKHGSTACRLNIVATVLTILIIITLAIVFLVWIFRDEQTYRGPGFSVSTNYNG